MRLDHDTGAVVEHGRGSDFGIEEQFQVGFLARSGRRGMDSTLNGILAELLLKSSSAF